MAEQAVPDPVPESAELPLDSAGAQLARARVAKGLSHADVAAATRIPERHIVALEAGNYGELPARTYAAAFARSYAKVVGLNPETIARTVRSELGQIEPESPPRVATASFEPGDPARVPGPRIAWGAALGALAVVIAGLVFWRSYYAPGGSLPSILPSPTASASAPTPAASPATAPGGAVVFTALEDKIWVKFYDGAGNQLMQKQMAKGETWTVPATVPDVKIWTARPEALAITIGGKPVAKLADTQKTVKDVSVTAQALLARGAPAPNGTQPPAPASATHTNTGTGTAAPTHHSPTPHHDPARTAPAAASEPSPAAAAPAAPAPAPAATPAPTAT